MAARVEQNYKERATSIDRWGRYTSVEVPYIVFDAADEDAALTAVLNTAPKTLHNLPLDAIEIDSREGDTTFKVNATYKAENSTDSYGDVIALCNTKKTELLFLALFTKMLEIGGRCASIVPDGVLFGSSKAHKAIRKELIEKQRLEAVISMPSGVFKPYAGVSTAIVIFTKTDAGGTDKVWFYDMKADGFSLDDKRSPIDQNDIPDVIEQYQKRFEEPEHDRTERSFFVPKAEIVENGYDLSINKYKKTDYVAEEYPPTSQLLAEIDELENQFQAERKTLKGLLNNE